MSMERVLRMGTGEVLTILRSGADTGGSAFGFEAVLPPGLSGPPPHRHRVETETFSVLEGVLRVRVGDRVRVLEAGESVTVPPGAVHAFSNPSDRPARIRTVETPAGPLEDQFRALAAAGRIPPLRRLARINVEHDLSFSVHGIPDRIQRPLWRALAILAPADRPPQGMIGRTG
ncbi:cupin domain-containing protein [Pseudonocardia nigra]|uniref:cupin domain-containing protein n=1 Tax=Pseudonocardia nigra TaxID=1921578 RepID=UPI001C5D242C|nr:cupin domain-containing protein [Pseudonocardia nigra]